MATRPMRADARRSRSAIVEAYKQLAAERGALVPLYEVARAAGVGQGTLYRHFPSRTTLAAAVFSEVLDGFEALARREERDPDLFLRLLTAALRSEVDMHGLSRVLVGDHAPELAILQGRTTAVFLEPLAAAQRAGRIRSTLLVDDITVMLSMLDGVMNGVGSPLERRAAAERAIMMLLDGIRSPSPSGPRKDVPGASAGGPQSSIGQLNRR